MLRHIVLIKLDPQKRAEALSAIVPALNELPSKIKEIRGYDVGVDSKRGANSADISLISEFDDASALQRYIEHPDHRRVVDELIKPNLSQIISVDYET
ncbi:MAG: Dabb family protein [Candidatus Lernaella stagnicola]|nr:Dabb family protein [Candidatus Lernaella stagnicola]